MPQHGPAQAGLLLADALAPWEPFKAGLPASTRQEPGRALAFADTRLQAWQKALIEAGSHPGQQGDLLQPWQGEAVGLAAVAWWREALWPMG